MLSDYFSKNNNINKGAQNNFTRNLPQQQQNRQQQQPKQPQSFGVLNKQTNSNQHSNNSYQNPNNKSNYNNNID